MFEISCTWTYCLGDEAGQWDHRVYLNRKCEPRSDFAYKTRTKAALAKRGDSVLKTLLFPCFVLLNTLYGTVMPVCLSVYGNVFFFLLSIFGSSSRSGCNLTSNLRQDTCSFVEDVLRRKTLPAFSTSKKLGVGAYDKAIFESLDAIFSFPEMVLYCRWINQPRKPHLKGV